MPHSTDGTVLRGGHVVVPLDERPVAGVQDGVVHIRPLGPIPAFLEGALEGGGTCSADLIDDSAFQLQLSDLRRTDPHRVDLCYMITRLLAQAGQMTEARSWCECIPASQRDVFWYWQMGELLSGDWACVCESLRCHEVAAQREPDNKIYRLRWAWDLCRGGRLEEGLAEFEALHHRYPQDEDILFGFLWYRQYRDGTTRLDFREGFVSLAALSPGPPVVPIFSQDRDPERPLRIGILSPDICRNSAAVPLELLLDGLDRKAFSLYGYGRVAHTDEVTVRLQDKFDHYESISSWSVERIADRIRADRIDILVEIGGYVRDHCLAVFKQRPAPIQVDFQGISTTGLGQMDYRFTDRILDPPEALDAYVETSIYLEGGCHCFSPPPASPLVGPLPALKNGVVTFGVFNNHIKICENQLALWAQLLRDTPGARLLIKFPCAHDARLRALYREKLLTLGIAPDRIAIHAPKASFYDHLDLYNEVDIALDTFPFNGSMTTLEGLWMGVPVVTRGGEPFVSQVGRSILGQLDLEVFCTQSPEEYLAKAQAFAQQIDSLALVRQSLRARMLNSNLCKPRRMAAELEKAFRSMWRRWCVSN